MELTEKYQHLLIYYFSGTGNAKKCAEWMAEEGRKANIDTHLINIDRVKTIELPPLSGKTLIGFCSPTHGFNMPPIMLKFIYGFPVVKDASVFILNTRGGLKMHTFFIPGLSGVAQYLPAIMLLCKGFRIVGMQPVDLPSNWILLHPGLRKKVVLSLFEKYKRIVRQFAVRLLEGKTKYQAFWSLPLDLAIVPIAVGYYFAGRFFLAKTLVATSKCDSCKVCVHNCPVNAIKWVGDRPFWTWKCESCMRCVNQCPERAIEVAHTFVAFLIYAGATIAGVLYFDFLLKQNFMHFTELSFVQELIWRLLRIIVMLSLFFIGYRLMHYLMRFHWFNVFISYTSLSRFKWWRRYQPNKLLKGKNN